MVERDALGPGSGGISPGQGDGEDGESADGLAAAGDGLDAAGGSLMAGDVAGDAGEDEEGPTPLMQMTAGTAAWWTCTSCG